MGGGPALRVFLDSEGREQDCPNLGCERDGVGAYVLTLPLMCWYLGRQGSSGNGSWENTESSPEEQELRVSGKLGEYCSDGMQRSRYSCKKRIPLEDLSKRLKKSLWLTGDSAVVKLRDFPEDCERVLFL